MRCSPDFGAASLVASLLLLVACDGNDGMKAEPREGVIAFSVNRGGWNEIWLMEADGSERRRLTELEPSQSDAAGNMSPAWSPDGTRIAFSAQIGSRVEDQHLTEIYIMRADGTDRRRLTTNDLLDASPGWSPDGKRIAFARLGEQETDVTRSGIFVMDADGGGEVQVTQSAWPNFDFSPAWSPDGSLIAFTRAARFAGSLFPKVALYAVTPEGEELRRLTSEGGDADWSPDGTRIAFTALRDRFGQTCFHECSTSGEIYVLEVDSGKEQRLTETEADEGSPAWSPDGRLIAFASDRSNANEHEIEMYVMNASGDEVRRITRNEVWDREPAWQP